MVVRLVAAGHDVVALGRIGRTAPRPRAAGCPRGRATCAEAGAQADVVVVCVFTDEQVRQVCLDGALLPAMPSGSTLVVHTTASPNTVEAIAARARDVDVVDAPVSGGPHDIAAGQLTLFVGGADDTVARVRPVLGCYGDPVLHVGPIGAGQKVKLVNNALFAGHIGLLAESVRLGERLGVPESALLAALPSRQRRQPGAEHRRGTGFRRVVHRGRRRIRRQRRRRRPQHRRGTRQRSRRAGRRHRGRQPRHEYAGKV